MEYPVNVQIQTKTVCNAHCVFCPHSFMKSHGTMTEELFDDLLAQMASWDVHPAIICPYTTNEPFADPRIFYLCEKINNKLPNAHLIFYTNASLLDEEKLTKLLALKNVEEVVCSLHHTNKIEYRLTMGLDFMVTMDNIIRLCERRGEIKVRVLKVNEGDEEANKQFLEFCRAKFIGAEHFIAHRVNWKGDIALIDPELYLNVSCGRHRHMSILFDGKVALCCLDQDADYCLGDATKTPLLEIFNGEARLRYSQSVGKVYEPCNRCNML